MVVVGEDRGSRGTLEDPARGEAVQGISTVAHRQLGTREDVYRHTLPFQASMTVRDTRQNLPSPVGNLPPVHGADPRRSRLNCIELQHIQHHCPWGVDPRQPMPSATAHLARVVPSPEVISPLFLARSAAGMVALLRAGEHRSRCGLYNHALHAHRSDTVATAETVGPTPLPPLRRSVMHTTTTTVPSSTTPTNQGYNRRR